jgi:hypothetical protein
MIVGGSLKLSFRPIYHEKNGQVIMPVRSNIAATNLARGACVPLMKCSAIERGVSVYFG